MLRRQGGSGASAPTQYVVAVHSETEDIGGNEPELRGSNSDNADDRAVGAGNDPTLPLAPTDQVGREQRKGTRDVVETKQDQPSPTTTGLCRPSLVMCSASV